MGFTSWENEPGNSYPIFIKKGQKGQDLKVSFALKHSILKFKDFSKIFFLFSKFKTLLGMRNCYKEQQHMNHLLEVGELLT